MNIEKRIGKLQGELDLLKMELNWKDGMIETPRSLFFSVENSGYRRVRMVEFCKKCDSQILPYEQRSARELQIITRCMCEKSEKLIYHEYL